MEAENVCRSGGDLCLTMVELSLVQSCLSGCDSDRADVEIDGGGFDGRRDRADSGGVDGQMLDLENRGKYVADHTPRVTHSTPYVTRISGACNAELGQYIQPTNSSLEFDLFGLSAVGHDPTLSEARPDDALTALSASNSGEYLPLDCVPCSEVRSSTRTVASDKLSEVAQRKKAVPQRRSQPTGTKPGTIPPTPAMDPGTEDDFSRLVDYVPECLDRFGFCVVDRFAGKSLAMSVRSEVLALYKRGSFQDGLLTNQAFAVTAVRGDRVLWLEHEDDEERPGICKLIRRLDDLFLRLRGCLGSCHISSRSKVGSPEILILEKERL